MYERSAIVLERYFDKMFGYDLKNNIKTNFKDYKELVECLEKYKNISEEEDIIIQEYEVIANKIREAQKIQENLQKKNSKFQDERNSIFQNLDDDVDFMKKKLENLNNNIHNIDEDIIENTNKFIAIIQEFNEKTTIRSQCGKSKREIENKYNKKLNETLDDYKSIDINYPKLAKKFIEMPVQEIKQELKENMMQNGEKEKIPFNIHVLEKAIDLELEIQKKETQILSNTYDKTNRLFNEIKNNSTRIDRHKKVIKDSECQIEFIFAIKEYLIQFLDNERLTAVNTQNEHNSLMQEACKNFDEDVKQINNLYTLLLKEITKKISKKAYNELYNLEYLQTLKNKADEFDEQIKRLNLSVTIINPNYWRIEGMKKIYDVFYKWVTEEYGRDLSEYQLALEETEEDDIEENDDDEDTQFDGYVNSQDDNYSEREEIDKKIDMILGLDSEKETDIDWDNDTDSILDYEAQTDEKDELEDDWNDEGQEDDDWNDDELEEIEDDWDDQDSDNEEDDDEYEDDDWDFEEDDDELFDDEQDKDKVESVQIKTNMKNTTSDAKEDDNDNWENRYIKIENKKNKERHAKKTHKRGFFNKFKKNK